MSSLKGFLGGTFAALYFVFAMLPLFLLLIFTPLMFFSDVDAIRSSGFAGPDYSLSLIGVSGFIVGLSMLIPALRRMYQKLPWLYPFVKIMFVNLVVINIGLMLLNYGYRVQNEARHSLFFVLMIVQLVVCRVAMSFYFSNRPARYTGKG